jgi:hypothetical protein
MSIERTTTNDTIYVAYDDIDYHVVDLEVGQQISTGKPNLEEFGTPEDAVAWLLERAPDKLLDTARLREHLIPDGIPEWEEGVTYPLHAIVSYAGFNWLCLNEGDAKPSAAFDIKTLSGNWIPIGWFDQKLLMTYERQMEETRAAEEAATKEMEEAEVEVEVEPAA